MTSIKTDAQIWKAIQGKLELLVVSSERQQMMECLADFADTVAEEYRKAEEDEMP